MNRMYIGIDPGKSGGIAVIYPDGKGVAVPYSDFELGVICEVAGAICEVIKQYKPMCCLEKVGAMPGQGVTSMFNFGKNYGYIKGFLEAYKIPYQEVPPQKWKKEFGLNSDKTASVEVCKRLFPFVDLLATPRCKKPHDGMAEALLLAEYARRKL